MEYFDARNECGKMLKREPRTKNQNSKNDMNRLCQNSLSFPHGLVMALSLTLVSCIGEKAVVQNPADVVIIPDANLVASFDLAATQNAPIYMSLLGLNREDIAAAQLLSNASGQMEMLSNIAMETLGITEKDVSRVTMSAKMDEPLGMDLEEGSADSPDAALAMLLNRQERLEKAEIAIGLEVSKSITVDQLEAFFNAIPTENEDALKMKRANLSGNDCLVMRTTDGESYLTVVSKGRVILGGTRKGIENAVQRANNPVPLGTALAAGGMPSGKTPDWFISMILSDAMKAEMAASQSFTTNGKGMEAVLASCFEGMHGATIAAEVGDKIDLKVHVKLASEEKADRLVGVIDSTAIALLKLAVSMLSEGRPMPILDTIATSHTGDTANLELSLTEEDLDALNTGPESQ